MKIDMATLTEIGMFVSTPVKPEPPLQDPSSTLSPLLAMPSLDSTQTAAPPPRPQPKQTHRRRKASGRRPARSTTVAPPRSSIMRGVTRHTRTGRFDAHLWCDGRQWYLGAFTSELLAGAAYDVAAIKMRPNELPLNLPIERYQGRLGRLLDTVWQLHLFMRASYEHDCCSQMTVEQVLEATRQASKKRDVFLRPDAQEFSCDHEAMLGLLLQAFEAVAAASSDYEQVAVFRVLTSAVFCAQKTTTPPTGGSPGRAHVDQHIPPTPPRSPPAAPGAVLGAMARR